MEDQVGSSNVPKHKRGNPLKSGEKQMILHCFNTLSGSELGFVDSGLFVIESKSMPDHHEEITGEVLLMWIRSILPDSSSSDEEHDEEE
jgi:hypothetical protein